MERYHPKHPGFHWRFGHTRLPDYSEESAEKVRGPAPRQSCWRPSSPSRFSRLKDWLAIARNLIWSGVEGDGQHGGRPPCAKETQH